MGGFIPVVDKGTISWPDKYVKTDIEAMLANKDITDPTKRKISLESKKRELNAGGRRVDRAIIDELMAKAKEPKEVQAGLHVWQDFNPAHSYAIGADIGKGNGGDHSTSVIIDFESTPKRVVATYVNNEIPADQFAYELKRQGDLSRHLPYRT